MKLKKEEEDRKRREEQALCEICQDQFFEEKDFIVLIKCGHRVHRECQYQSIKNEVMQNQVEHKCILCPGLVIDKQVTELALDLSNQRAKINLRAAGFDPCLTNDCEGVYGGEFENLLICELCQ